MTTTAQRANPIPNQEFESNHSMNTEAIRKELSNYVYAHFDSADLDILNELTDIFVRSHSSLFTTSGERTTTGLDIDTLSELLQSNPAHRARNAKLIAGCLDAALYTYVAGTRNTKTQLTFKTFEAFIMGCMCLRSPRAVIVSRFSAKCTSMVVRLHVALQKDLAKTRAELAEERAQVQRRAYLVIKEAVREWRRENGYRYTDCAWRIKNFSTCCKRLAGITYKVGATPYVKPAYLKNAHIAIKRFYGLSMNNIADDLPAYTQTKLPF